MRRKPHTGAWELIGGVPIDIEVDRTYANSSFLTDGTGMDQNYPGARALTQNMWSTVVNFHSGDNITLWGVTQADFTPNCIGDTRVPPVRPG